MKISILFFATLKDRAKTNRAELTLPDGATVAQLKKEVAARFPNVAPALPTCIASRNKEFADDTDPLADGDEVALFPPVSGGTNQSPITIYPTIFRITNDALDLDALVASITLSSTGAACVFTGLVRGVTARGDAHDTTYLEYEAYVPMAEAKMKQVADEIRGQWPGVEGVAIVQRIGRLYPGTPTVLIACTAAHRDTGVFEAARYGIDRLKEIVPIWKKEIGPGVEEWVEGEYLPTGKDKETSR
ncbi:MAG TPA: molybdopterin converting factor subunit 1 [Anaerolineales bacterium]|nr:molybdopterin converting factor subunit 1 [Anaerolineales bacterium]